MTTQHPTPADLAVTGANVLTFDAAGTNVEAIAVRQGRIVAVGTDDDITCHIGPRTTLLELPGRTVLPGINDSHLHATWLGAIWPVTFMNAPTEVPAGRLVSTASQRRAAILRAGQLCASLGITSYTEPGLGQGENHGETGCFGPEVLAAYAELAAEGALSARVTVLRLFGVLDGPSELGAFETGLNSAVPGGDPEWFNVTGVKIFADGIPPMHTAWTRHRYPDGTNGGLLVAGSDDSDRERNFRAMIDRAHARGLQIGVHATGDRAIDAVIDAVSSAVCRHGPGNRHYVIHGDLVTPGQLARMRELDIGLTTQPGIATATAEQVAKVLPREVAQAAWPMDELLSCGVPFTLSSDAPVLGPDWRVQIAAAAQLLDSPDEPGELMRRLLRCYTTEAARQDCAEHWKGSLEVGKVADFCVLDADPLTIEPSSLPGVGVEATVTGGKLVFQLGQAAVR